jgi:molecular chaperone GrpE
MSPKPTKKQLEEKTAELEASLKEEREKADRYLNQLKYARADLENLQKRTQRSIEEALDRANGRLLMQLLPILDELDLAIKAAKMPKGDIAEGVEMVRNKLAKLMEAEGVSSIEAVGKSFDPRLHEAVLEVETNDHPNGCVVEEFRKGYKFKGRVLRASMVKVARNPDSDKVKVDVKDERGEEREDPGD